MAPAPPASSLRLATVTFTGKLASMTRAEARRIVREAGGRATGSVSRRTTLLVVGMDGWPLLPDGSASGKLRKAEVLHEQGGSIEIVSEEVFLERAGLGRRRPELRKSYPFDRVCGLLDVEPATLRRWEALGLVRSEDGQLDFQDIVSLRTVTDLLRRGIPAQTIGRSVRGLAAVLPGTERPLAQLTLVERDGDLLAEIGEALVAPDGQLVLDFDRPVGAASSGPLPLVAMITGAGTEVDAGTAEAWLEQGIAHEEADRFDDAIAAYRRALGRQPRFPEAHFNLGNALRAVERPDAAEAHFQMAVAQDPALAEAWYNLADVQEEAGRAHDAIASLESALAADPTYADAHYNLALLCETTQQPERARTHWRAYLRLDPGSEWSETARGHLV